jgi:methyltransferase (TIGR00027 family)
MNGVALTALWVAARRAIESEREDALFHDPFARTLAGEEGFAVLARARTATTVDPPTIPVRTHFFDERITRGPHQVVLLAAGMDARAFRLAWPEGTRLFEVDQPQVLALKSQRLGGARPACARVEVAIDLRDDWPAALEASGFDRRSPTSWLVEGLLPYLDETSVHALFARIDALAATGSVLFADVLGRTMMAAAPLQRVMAFVRELGAPWTFGTDQPEALLAPLGWDVTAHDLGAYATSLGRWPFAVAPAGARHVPRSFLVDARKR